MRPPIPLFSCLSAPFNTFQCATTKFVTFQVYGRTEGPAENPINKATTSIAQWWWWWWRWDGWWFGVRLVTSQSSIHPSPVGGDWRCLCCCSEFRDLVSQPSSQPAIHPFIYTALVPRPLPPVNSVVVYPREQEGGRPPTSATRSQMGCNK